MNRRSLLVIIIALSFFLSSCTIQLTTNINSSGGGNIRAEIGFTPMEASLLEYGSTTDICAEMHTELDFTNAPNDAEYFEEQRGENTWCGVKIPFSSLDELRDAYADMDIVVNELSISGGELIYDIVLPRDFFGGGTNEFDLASFNFTWQIILPGRIVESNASNVNGNILTWNLNGYSENQIYARSSLGPNWLSIGIGIGVACLCLLFIVALLVGAFFLFRKSAPSSSEELNEQ